MSSPSLIVVAGPSGSGKTTWISQFLRQPATPTYYLCPGLGNASVDLAGIDYRFRWVQTIPDTEVQTVLSRLSEEA
ncbi:MAG: GTP-binding protein, partial [Cyanobacteria bacterium]|nr:GTP-binding protein [Cyanobacteria bacterium GSL.Bin21]